jgi:uncharacterized protein
MSNELHRRYLSRKQLPIKLEQRSDGALPKIVGYAAVFYRDGDPTTEYEMWPAEYGFPRVVERVQPGAFDRALKEDDVRALFNHETDKVLGRSASGTLRLSVDAVGLRYEIDPPDTHLAHDLIQSLQRGDISGSSFAFVPRGTVYRDTKEGDVQVTYVERTDVQLFDVGPVTYPAYGGATSGLRSADGLAAARAEIIERRAARDRDELELTLILLGVDD